MKIEKVALLGAGAVGAYFVWGLSEKMGDDFCVVAKGERKKRLEREFQAYIDSTYVHHIAASLWKEVSQVANAKGIPLQEELILFQGPKPDARFSTLQDLDEGRHTEIEMFAGEMMRMGKECQIAVPYCEYTYHLIKALEEKNDGKFEYYVGREE